MGLYIGVDYHRRYSYVTVMNEGGSIVRHGRVGNSKEALAQFLGHASDDGPRSAVLEATRNWTVMHDWLEELVNDVHLAHPLKVKAIAEAKIKTDQIDATVLAHLLSTNLLPTAHIPGATTRECRTMLRQRMFFVRLRTMVKNRIQVLLDRYPERLAQKPCPDLFSRAGRSWLTDLPLKPTDDHVLREDLHLLDELNAHLQHTDRLVERLAAGDARVTLLKTIPGIGQFFAGLIAYEVDTISRFAHEKKLFSDMGLVPSTYASGGRTFHGRLTKQGNRY
ncbi:IS110 family transposase [Nitrospira sp. Kam-Ns4a]